MAADVDALNYPYIRVRSTEWLKRTLLIFPHVVRMTPGFDAPPDDPEIEKFCRIYGSRGPLLRPADLMAQHVSDVQYELINELQIMLHQRGAAFRNEFGREAALGRAGVQLRDDQTVWDRRLSGRDTFQIHRHKMLDSLVEFLRRERLAWKPSDPDGPRYLEMHPRLGEAVMATLALACAENEGLCVVTEFPDMHGKLIRQPRRLILRACLEEFPQSGETSDQQIAEFLIYRRCDVTKLTAERIAALKSERDALVDFRNELEKLAKSLPPTIFSEPHLLSRLNDSVNDILKRWQADQANLSKYAKELFGIGSLSEPAKLIQKLVESAATPAVAGAAGAIVGNLTLGLATGAAAGFAIAVVFRSVNARANVKRRAHDSPFRYLSKLADEGVVFSMSE